MVLKFSSYLWDGCKALWENSLTILGQKKLDVLCYKDLLYEKSNDLIGVPQGSCLGLILLLEII